MCYREGVEIKFILKIKQNFMDNPIVSLSGNDIKIEEVKDAANGENEDEENEDYEGDSMKIIDNKENIDEIFEKQNQFQNLYLNELLIYKIDD